ncbi:MAG TPA: hypothetical protein VFU32_06670 [Ktedonobacterales bacterium]|nr:hypothetical protein [Ktedonobacterales bacterium]
MQWTQRDLRALRWIGEQYAIRLDQLAMLLARWQAGPTQTPGRLAAETVRKLVQRWKRAGLVDSGQLVRGEPGWVWLTRLGLEHLELDYRLWEPKAQSLPHLYVINQARLWVEQRQPEACWRSERQLRSEHPFVGHQGHQEHRPDAEVLIGSQAVAIEAERQVKAALRLPTIFYELARSYDAIWYFCPTPLLEPMRRAFAQLDPPTRQKFSLVELP